MHLCEKLASIWLWRLCKRASAASSKSAPSMGMATEVRGPHIVSCRFSVDSHQSTLNSFDENLLCETGLLGAHKFSFIYAYSVLWTKIMLLIFGMFVVPGSFSFPAVPPRADLEYEVELLEFDPANEVLPIFQCISQLRDPLAAMIDAHRPNSGKCADSGSSACGKHDMCSSMTGLMVYQQC